MNELVTCNELSIRLKLKKQSIYNMISRGEFCKNKHYFKPTRRILLFDWEAINDWLRGSNVEDKPSSDKVPQRLCPSQNQTKKAQPLNLINI